MPVEFQENLEPFQDVIVRCNDLKSVVIFHRDERGQLDGQPATFRWPL
jgi:hypothetical protein